MLDITALNQLKTLKQHIQDSTIRSRGIVKGTSKRFGFVTDEKDGQQYLLPQATMDLLLPGDEIEFVLEKTDQADQKPIARVEKLLNSSFSYFIGQVKAKNGQLFVAPDHAQLKRWIFIPPKQRKNLQEGFLVSARISQHPFRKQGRVQADITDILGQPDDPFIEHRYAIAREGISEKIWQADDIEAIRQTSERLLEEALAGKTDCRDQLFVTIDGAATQDMDDALAIQSLDDGWRLSVAIADASIFVTPGSPLDRIAAGQASTIYMPGQKVPMLPDILTSDLCSLRPQQDRLALVCELDISQQGEIRNTRYLDAVINSKAKLSYDEVAAFLDSGAGDYSDEIRATLSALQAAGLARRAWRKQHAQVMEEYPDYRLQLNDKGKITQIDRLERNCAQSLVEECMLSCNEATARFLQQQVGKGIFLNHDGFKQDQLTGIDKLLGQYFPGHSARELTTLDGYLAFVKNLDGHNELPFYDILRKKLVRSEWSCQPRPHYGLGLPAYTTFTSPMRKYSDLIVHRIIKAWLAGNDASAPDDSTMAQLNDALLAVRRAQRDCEMSLKCQYLQAFRNQAFDGEISMINHRVIGVYLAPFDVHGQIDVQSLGEAFTFRQDTLQLLSDSRTFQLKQPVRVTIDHVDVAQRSIKLKLADTQ